MVSAMSNVLLDRSRKSKTSQNANEIVTAVSCEELFQPPLGGFH